MSPAEAARELADRLYMNYSLGGDDPIENMVAYSVYHAFSQYADLLAEEAPVVQRA